MTHVLSVERMAAATQASDNERVTSLLQLILEAITSKCSPTQLGALMAVQTLAWESDEEEVAVSNSRMQRWLSPVAGSADRSAASKAINKLLEKGLAEVRGTDRRNRRLLAVQGKQTTTSSSRTSPHPAPAEPAKSRADDGGWVTEWGVFVDTVANLPRSQGGLEVITAACQAGTPVVSGDGTRLVYAPSDLLADFIKDAINMAWKADDKPTICIGRADHSDRSKNHPCTQSPARNESEAVNDAPPLPPRTNSPSQRQSGSRRRELRDHHLLDIWDFLTTCSRVSSPKDMLPQLIFQLGYGASTERPFSHALRGVRSMIESGRFREPIGYDGSLVEPHLQRLDRILATDQAA
jgi:hypothetical protein